MTYQTEDPSWAKFYPSFSAGFYVDKAGYFDERPEPNTSVTQLIALVAFPFLLPHSLLALLLIPFIFFGWGKLFIHLPIATGIQDCTSAAWGFNYHDNKIWIYIGGGGNFEGGRKWKTITMGWDLTWARTTTCLADGKTHFHETKKNRLKWQGKEDEEGSYEWLQKNKWKQTHPFLDKYDNTTVNATISLVEREWRPISFQWTSLFAKKRAVIEIEFDKEVGARKGEWKGGCLACSYELEELESPYECLKRMERERKF